MINRNKKYKINAKIENRNIMINRNKKYKFMTAISVMIDDSCYKRIMKEFHYVALVRESDVSIVFRRNIKVIVTKL